MSRIGVMLAKKATDAYLARMPAWVLVQPKMDGDRCRAIWKPDTGYQLVSSQGNGRNFSVPHIVQALNYCGEAQRDLPTFDGELYIHGISFQMIRSVVSRTKNLHPDHKKVRFHAFDIISDAPQMDRIAHLNGFDKIWRLTNALRVVDTYKKPNNFEDLQDAMRIYLEEGYEGVIVRDPRALYTATRTDQLLKIKPDKTDIAAVTAFHEAISIEGEPKGMVGSFTVEQKLGDEYGAPKITFKVSAGRLTHDERRLLWRYRGSMDPRRFICHYRYLMLTDDGKPREPTCVKLEEVK